MPRTTARSCPTCSLSGPPRAGLPVGVPLVAEPDQELPSLLFEGAFVLLGKVVFPVTRYPLAVERRGVLLPPLASPGELLEARRAHAVLHQLILPVDPQEAEQSPYLFIGTFQQVFVAHLRVVRPEQRRSVFDGPAH